MPKGPAPAPAPKAAPPMQEPEIVTVTLHKPIHVQLLERVMGTLRRNDGYRLFRSQYGITLMAESSEEFETIHFSNICSTLERYVKPADAPGKGVPPPAGFPSSSTQVRGEPDPSAGPSVPVERKVQSRPRRAPWRKDSSGPGDGGSGRS